jgi:hypothetical protein
MREYFTDAVYSKSAAQTEICHKDEQTSCPQMLKWKHINTDLQIFLNFFLSPPYYKPQLF